MVHLEKRKVVVRSKSGKGSDRVRQIETLVSEYEDSRVPGTNIVVSVAVATFHLKHEDRHQVLRLSDDETFRASQKKLRCEPRMAAFVGVFDGHDGDLASEYCCRGLAPHIIAELAGQSTQKGGGRWSFANDQAMAPLNFDSPPELKKDSSTSDMQIQYIAAFQKAHDRFTNNLEPPSFEEVCNNKPGALKVAPPTSYNPMQWMTPPAQPQRGGTTACTMSVFTELGEDIPTVVVANTGDSRLITDDASGSGKYRQVTTEHRPSNPAEKRRLTQAVARGDTYMHRTSESADVRVFPGGLAVSRTIGDGNCSKSVICTPEVINVPLKISLDRPGEKTQRFVLASDGLWDTLDNGIVGRAAARVVKRTDKNGGKSKVVSSPREAAANILQQCLETPGGNRDDVTICVVDVSYSS